MKVKGLHLIVVAAVLALVAQADATNYLVNGDMETHWGHTPVLNLQYTGPGADCRINVDVANHRLQTIVDGNVDLDIDLSDRPSYEEQFLLKAAIEATGNYTVAYPGWNGLNRGGESYSPTTDYSDAWNGMVNIKQEVGSIPEGLPTAWGSYGSSTSGASMFAHSGKYSLQVYDNRPSAVPGSPVSGSPESVNMSQEVSAMNPDWTELIGQEVTLSGWVYLPSNSYLNETVDDGYLIRIHHGVGGATVTDFENFGVVKDQWNYFEHTFTVDPASDFLKIILFARPSINQVYWGQGTVYFDDMVLIPEPATISLLGLGLAVLLRRRKV